MKKSVLIFLLCLVGVLLAQGRQLPSVYAVSEIKFRDVVEIGNRNAVEQWGMIYPAEPIPYYGPDDEIIAYHLNYSLKGAFPDAEVLKTRCAAALAANNRDGAWGVGDFGNMVIGAKPYMPVFIQSSQSLSEQYVYGRKLEKAALEAFPDGYTKGKTYYLGYVNVWHQISYKNTNKYINLSPPEKVITEEEFTKLKSEIPLFWKDKTFDDEWQRFMTNSETMGRSVVMIPGEEKMPYYEWSFGCTPSAGAMLLAWWDHYRGMGRFVSSHYERYDPRVHDIDYHVPPLQRQLSQAMGTNSEGTTYLGHVIDAYYEVVEANGYRCVCDGLWAWHHTDTTLYNGILEQINQGLPCQVGIWGHTIVGVGYNTSPKLVYIHDANHPSLMQIHKSFIWDYFYVHVYDDSGNNGVFMELTDPNGSTGWGHDLGGEFVRSGSIYEITWDSTYPNATVSIEYSLDAGDHWSIMETETENDGSYCWLVPELNPLYYPDGTSDKGRVRLTMRDPNDVLIAADGSYGSFNFRPGGSFPVIGASYTFNLPKILAKVDHHGSSWGVVTARSDDNENRCSVELFDDLDVTDFENSVMLATGNNLTNFIVLDNRILPDNVYGAKFNRIYPNGGANTVTAGFNNTPGTLYVGNHNLQWIADEAAKIWDIYLQPGNHYFKMDVSAETADLDFALFKSGGTGMFTRDGAVASSEHVNSGYDESFQYTVTQAGYYAILVTSNTYIGTQFTLSISDASVWTGNVSTSWHSAGNWQPQEIPGPNHAVVIPSGCSRYPVLTSANSPQYTQCKSLLIKSGAFIKLQDRNFEVVENMQVFGRLELLSSTSEFLVSGNITWEDRSTIYFGHNDAELLCYRDWTAKAGSYLTAPFRGTVKFISAFDSHIKNYSSAFSFPDLILEKMDNAAVIFDASSTQDLAVESHLIIEPQSILSSDSDRSISIRGSFANRGSCTLDNGTVRLIGQISSVSCLAGSYFNNLEISTQMLSTLTSDLTLHGDFILNSGGFVAGAHTIYVGGDWKNNMGIGAFQKGTSTVIFNGDGLSLCFGEQFANLKINNPDCQLSFVANDSTIDFYTWMAGALSMGGGVLTINDMPTTGIKGTYYIGQGTLNIHQNSNQPVDLVGIYHITNGILNIYGGLSPSVWTNGGDLLLLMRGGVLDFRDVGINISGSFATDLDIDITDGIIRTTGDFICTRTNFNPVGGSVELYGGGTANVSITSPSALANLILNKDSRSYDAGQNSLAAASSEGSEPTRTTNINLLTNLVLEGDLMIPLGTFDLCGKTVVVGNDLEIEGKLKMTSANDLLQVHSSVYWYAGSSAEITNGVLECSGDWNFLGGTANLTGNHHTIFKGEIPSLIHIEGSQAFAKVTLAKTSTTYGQNLVTIDTDMQITGNLSVSERSRVILSGTDLLIGGTLLHQSTSDLLIPEGNTITCDDLNLYTHLMADGGICTVQDAFTQQTGSQLSVEAGSFILNAPYNSGYFSILGDVALNGGTFQITNRGIQFGASSNMGMYGGTLKIGWGLRALTPDTFQQSSGTIEFFGTNSANIELASGNYLHNVVLSKTGSGTLILSTDTTLNNLTINSGTMLLSHHVLQVNGNVHIVGGALNAAFYDDMVNVYGNWTNSRGSLGFIEGNGTVAFVGNQASTITTSETFNILQIYKPMGYSYPLILGVGATLTASSYEYSTGVLYLSDSSILNTPTSVFSIPEGSALRCAPGTPPTININGNFVDNNMEIAWNTGFYSGNSIVNIVGTGNRQIESYNMKFNDLNINLSGASCNLINYTPEFTGNLQLNQGTLTASSGSNFTFHKSLRSAAGTNISLVGVGFNFVGSENAEISLAGTATYASLIIDKDTSSTVTLMSNLNMPLSTWLMVQQGILDLNSRVLTAGGSVDIENGGELQVDANAQLLMPMSSMLNVNSGGKLTALGTTTQPALISRTGSDYYSLNVYSGAFIAAEYAIFEYMDYGGVNINSGATVDPAYSFNNCTFRNSTNGSSLLSINNSQNLTISNAVFPTNTWDGMSNVSKTVDTGSIRFLNESGAFAGASNESDPYNRINWNSQNPAILVSQSTLSFGDVDMATSEYRTFTITNNGGGSLVGTLSVPDDFTAGIYRTESIVGNSKMEEPQRSTGMEYIVLPGSTIQVQVGFIPTQPIAYNSTLVISHNVSGNPINISLTGTGIGAQLTVNPTEIIKGILPGGSHTETLSITDSGNASLSYYASVEYPSRSRDVIMSESFESTTFPPTGWDTSIVTQVGTAGVWSSNTITIHPEGFYPQDGSKLALFNSWTCSSGNQTRLYTSAQNFTGYSHVSLSFWMYHNNRYPANHDNIQIQVNSAQIWENVGEPIDRVSATDGWQQHTISLSSYANQNYIRVGFLATSVYGDDIHIDNIVITGSNPPASWVFFNGQYDSASGVIAPGNTDQHAVTISTYGMEPGTYQAEIHIGSDDPITSIKIVPITVSVGSPGISVNPSSLPYPLIDIGSESLYGLYITNSGTIHLSGSITVPTGYHIQPATRETELSSLRSSSPSRWSYSEQFTLAPGAVGSYVVKFAPTAVQTYNGNIVISTDHLADVLVPVTGSGGSVPIVNTGGVGDLTANSVTMYGSIVDTGQMTILDKGFYYGTDPDPREYGEIVYSESSGNSFSVDLSGLDSQEQYYYCAFAVNAMGPGVGDVYLFNTLGAELSVSTTSLPSYGNVQINTASVPQSFTVSGSDLLGDVTISVPTGFRLALNPARSDNSRSDNQIVLSPTSGYLPETSINVYFQPTAVSAYTGIITISTPDLENQTITVSGTGISTPVVTTTMASALTTNSALAGGNVVSDGGNPILAKGVCWSLLPNPSIADAHSSDGSGTGNFSSTLSPLSADSYYYARAYATYATGTVYGNRIEFSTLAEAPTSAPTNLNMQIAGAYLTLSWNPVTNATSYKILSADTPEGSFTEDFRGVFSGTTWTSPISGDKKFYQVKAVGGLPSKFVTVPAGSFTMGRTTGTGDPDELPTHNVTLSAFQMGKHEVTQREWQDIMGTNPATGYGVGDLYPVYNVSWYGVIKYCNLRSLAEGLTPAYTINGSTNPTAWGAIPLDFDNTWDNVICNLSANGYRLPTEAEWEYAARGATITPDYIYAGSNDIDAVAWYYADGSPSGNKPIGGKTPNALGIYDLSGNVNELCWDWSNTYTNGSSENPTGPSSGIERIRRGGFWDALPSYCRVAQRDSSYPFIANQYLGFRLCKSAN